MTQALKSLLGVALIAAGVFAFLLVPERGAWPSLILVALGAHFVSNTQLKEFAAIAAKAAKELLPWKKGA